MADDIVQSINPPSPPLLESVPANNSHKFSFSNNPITREEIIEAISLLKNKNTPDQDGLSTSLVKKIANELASPLHLIFSKSYETGIIPNQLKIAKIIPIFKSGIQTKMDNYRPIALLNSFSKILEKITCNRLTNYLEYYKLLSEFQIGFKRNHSILHPLLLFLNKITTSLEKKRTFYCKIL